MNSISRYQLRGYCKDGWRLLFVIGLFVVGIAMAARAQDASLGDTVTTAAAGGSEAAISSKSGTPLSVTRLALDNAAADTGALDGAIVNLALDLIGRLHAPAGQHVSQEDLLNLVIAGQGHEAFLEAFEAGDTLFGTTFNALDGIGANVGNGQRFSRVPRADLTGPHQWASHTPTRVTGPNAEACADCHRQPVEDGSGRADSNVIRDPLRKGIVGKFINRNTPHLFGMAGIQLLAEEMTGTLHEIRRDALRRARNIGRSVTANLTAKGVSFGSVTARPNGSVNMSNVVGVSADLVVRPFQWKGNFAFVREFNRDASNQELGLGPVESTGFGVDGDFDGVADEMTVGDQTALAIYLAAQPRPTTRVELASLGLIPPLSTAELTAVDRGAQVFSAIGCANCHKSSLTVDNPTFTEPSQHANYRDAVFPAGFRPETVGVLTQFPVSFDITQDQPDNQILDDAGNVVFRLGSFERNAQGGAIVRAYSDLKRHDMGLLLAESIDEAGTGASVFMTRGLWGVGSTAPYLHDGRATTLTEAILFHGGEAAGSRQAFIGRSTADQSDLVAFLNNLVLFVMEGDEEE